MAGHMVLELYTSFSDYQAFSHWVLCITFVWLYVSLFRLLILYAAFYAVGCTILSICMHAYNISADPCQVVKIDQTENKSFLLSNNVSWWMLPRTQQGQKIRVPCNFCCSSASLVSSPGDQHGTVPQPPRIERIEHIDRVGNCHTYIKQGAVLVMISVKGYYESE
jgi:hypothetical protein